MQESFSIGALARLTSCQVVTIRYYEKIGILPEPARGAGGHRLYDRCHLDQLTFIRKARALGFPLGTVRSLLDLSESREDASCEEVDMIASARLAEVKAKIVDLRALEETLEGLMSQCRHTTVEECRILDAFRTRAAASTE